MRNDLKKMPDTLPPTGQSPRPRVPGSPFFLFSPSPRPRVSASPRPRVFFSARLPVLASLSLSTFRLPALWLVGLSLLFACGGPAVINPTLVGAPGTQPPPLAPEYRMSPGDRLSVKFFYNADLSQEVVVRPDGRISLPLVQEVMAAGLTPAELTGELTRGYEKHLEKPEITVMVNAFGGQRMYVGGEVGAPGMREIVGPTTALQAIASSGGFKDTARKDEVVLIRRGPENKPFVIALNLSKVMDGTDLSQDVYLVPFDIVVVPKSNIADTNLWVQQYLTNMVAPLSPFASWYFMVK
jgi:polysaccharide biosynthesis/export protein